DRDRFRAGGPGVHRVRTVLAGDDRDGGLAGGQLALGARPHATPPARRRGPQGAPSAPSHSFGGANMRFIVIGCGRTGAGLARRLEADGHDVTVVDTDAGAFDRLGPTFPGTTVHGVGFDRDVLARAGIDSADGLAAVTGNDEVNAVVARLASRMFHVPKVVARLHDPREAEIYRRLGVQVVAPVDWSIHRT